MSSHYCPKCGKFKSESFPLCDKCAKLEETNESKDSQNNSYINGLSAYKEHIAITDKKEEMNSKTNNNNSYRCKCGINVKSEGEKAIADFLHENKIQFFYKLKKQYCTYNNNWNALRTRSIYPNFFIGGPVTFHNRKIENVYIEYWESNTPKDQEKKEEKLKIYKHNNCTLINIYPEDTHNCESNLSRKLTQFIDRQINY